MTSSNPIVISQKIQHNSFIKLKAFFASVGVHGSIVAALLFLSLNEPQPVPMDGRPMMVSLANYTPSHKSIKSAAKTVSVPKKVKAAPLRPHPVKQKKIIRPLAQKQVIPTPAPTPQTIPSPDPTVLSEASSPQNTAVRSNAAPSTPVPLTQSPFSQDNSITNHSPANAPSASATNIINKNLSEAEIDGAALGRIRTMIENALTYPAIARKLRLEGTVVVSFILKTSGLVEKVEIATTSGSTMLDSKALQTVLALNGEYPTLPKTAFLKVPITFSLTRH
jgi:protein TonB